MNKNVTQLSQDELRGLLVEAYQGTCHQYNSNNNIESVGHDAIFEILSPNRLKSITDYGLFSYLIHSDGGVQHYQIWVVVENIRFIVGNFKMHNPDDMCDEAGFCGLDEFCDWLYKKIQELPKMKVVKKVEFE